jgi:hypothetical protein
VVQPPLPIELLSQEVSKVLSLSGVLRCSKFFVLHQGAEVLQAIRQDNEGEDRLLPFKLTRSV